MHIDEHFPNADWKPYTAWRKCMTLEGKWASGKLFRAKVGDYWLYRLPTAELSRSGTSRIGVREAEAEPVVNLGGAFN